MSFKLNEQGTARLMDRAKAHVLDVGRDAAGDSQPPVRTGTLARSIETSFDGERVTVLANTSYAAKIEARQPFLLPALRRRLRMP